MVKVVVGSDVVLVVAKLAVVVVVVAELPTQKYTGQLKMLYSTFFSQLA